MEYSTILNLSFYVSVSVSASKPGFYFGKSTRVIIANKKYCQVKTDLYVTNKGGRRAP